MKPICDSSKLNYKAVLLHNWNEYPPLSTAHTICMKETYENMHHLAKHIQYEKYSWYIYGDLRVIIDIIAL